jgi:single-strand DNA-binding protein
MAGSVNKVILVGNLGKDPEVRSFQNGGRVANFSVATSESWKDRQSGERKERTEWHRIVIYNENLVGIVEKYLKKGSKVYVEGKLETRKYTDKDGSEKFTTEVAIRNFGGELTLLDGRGEGGGGRDSGGDYGGGGNGGGYGGGGGFNQSAMAGKSGSGMGGDLDDEIPF